MNQATNLIVNDQESFQGTFLQHDNSNNKQDRTAAATIKHHEIRDLSLPASQRAAVVVVTCRNNVRTRQLLPLQIVKLSRRSLAHTHTHTFFAGQKHGNETVKIFPSLPKKKNTEYLTKSSTHEKIHLPKKNKTNTERTTKTDTWSKKYLHQTLSSQCRRKSGAFRKCFQAKFSPT